MVCLTALAHVASLPFALIVSFPSAQFSLLRVQAVQQMYQRLSQGELVTLPTLHHDTSVLDVEEDRIIWIREADLGKHAPVQP